MALTPAPLASSARPHLFMVVDTEEEFDWSKPLARENVAVTAIAETPRLQEIVEPFGLKPTYVIDFPVAATASSANLLGGFAASNRCEIGAHLHPWVNPPYTETLGLRNSYACNLGIDLECQKIASLKQAIATGLGVEARAYKAGRYGFGPTTAQVLETLDFDVDLSVNPHMDFRSDGGPSFEGYEPVPSTFGGARRLLELPCTTSFVGMARRFGAPLHRLASQAWLEPFKAVGVLSRSGMVNKVMLSPEGSTYQEMRALTDTLLDDGLRTFALTFHSPSLKPGCTRYVTNERERDSFLQVITQYCSYFFNEIGGVPTTPSALYRQIVGDTDAHISQRDDLMKVLGISPLDKDSTVTVVEDGVITYAAGEERFTRVKMQNGFPWRALEDALNRTGSTIDEFDSITYPFLPAEEETRLFERNLAKEREFLDEVETGATLEAMRAARERVPAGRPAVPGLADPNEKMEKGFLKSMAYRMLAGEGVVSRNVAKRESERWGRTASEFHAKWHQELETSLSELGGKDKLKRVEHHLSHAANAYFNSGFDEALVVTLDGYGSGLAGSINVGRGGKIERLHGLEYPHSLGTFYESVTSALGFKPSRHEGKIVGLAAYGDPEVLGDLLRKRFVQKNGGFKIIETNNLYFARLLASEFPKIDVAAAYQRVLEEVAVTYVSQYVKKTGLRNLVLSGGVVANVKLNQRLKEIDGVDGIFIHPNMGDGGCGTGAALLEFPGNPAIGKRLNDVYFGPEYTPAEIVESLNRAQLPFTEYRPIEPKIAALLAAGKVVARFEGRMEYGPRALGHRSILYHAKEPAVNQWLNQRLGRTEFMPFAPATLYEHRLDCYKNMSGGEYAALFMTLTFDCTAAMKRDSPAAVHIDGTARPQLVSAESSPGFHRIITEYHKLTGIPSVVNTSFNMHEEPIVCTPDDAVRAFLQGNLDYLAIGDFLVEHPSSRH